MICKIESSYLSAAGKVATNPPTVFPNHLIDVSLSSSPSSLLALDSRIYHCWRWHLIPWSKRLSKTRQKCEGCSQRRCSTGRGSGRTESSWIFSLEEDTYNLSAREKIEIILGRMQVQDCKPMYDIKPVSSSLLTIYSVSKPDLRKVGVNV